jgi:hypothetical protein
LEEKVYIEIIDRLKNIEMQLNELKINRIEFLPGRARRMKAMTVHMPTVKVRGERL